MSYKYYLKKLTSNELGYRNGKLSNGQMFYISKQATQFFPPLSSEINNDKFNREGGTRDEYRIYLNREIAPDDFFYKPDDIIVMERKDENKYVLEKFRPSNKEYDKLDAIISESKMRGKHALINRLN